MPPDLASQANTAIAQRIQEKFDAYLLGLIFTILGLSIQTAKFGSSPIADASEIIGWVLFLVAGLAGLSRLEGASEIYRLYGVQAQKEEAGLAGEHVRFQGKTEVYVAPLGKSVPVEQYIGEAKQSVGTVEKAIKPLQTRGYAKYRIMKYSFVAGLLALMVARALVPIRGIVHAWTTR